ncbi:hypothetical protein C8R47DRAFT_1215696 [Mycena vitilis]|nr:hypothetical protein C8R47DRAFT_1215696 [Mycena vitilis]
MNPDVPDALSRTTSTFFSAHSGAGEPTTEPLADSATPGPRTSDDSLPPRAGLLSPEPLGPARRASSASHAQVQVTLRRDEDGTPYLVDGHGYRVLVAMSSDDISATSSNDEQSGVPMHHTALFGLETVQTSPPPRAYHHVSPPPIAYRATSEGTPEPLPTLDLDIDPGTLNNEQIGQLNAIRAHIGTANAQLTTSTAIIAEQQAATEDVHDTIHAVRTEVVSRLDSLRNEVNSQRARLNRCLDDNLRTLRDNGASTNQVNELLEILTRGGGSHRLPKPAYASTESVSARQPDTALPADIQRAANALVPPRAPHESLEDFETRARAVYRTKEQAHRAFPLPPIENQEGPMSSEVDPLTRHHTVLNSRHPATVIRGLREIERLDAPKANTASHARFRIPSPTPGTAAAEGSASSISGYRSSVGPNGRDVMIDFADDMSELIRATIYHRVGEHIELPPHVRPAKIDNRSRYSGQDDHEDFMSSLEKFLGWIRTSGYGGPELDTYRVSLIGSAFLDGDAHKWFTAEIDNPRVPGHGQLDFADILCALHRRYVKSSSAQRATRAFEGVRWDSTTGPEKLMSELLLKGQAMVEMPSPFLIKDRFLKAIPNWLSKELKMRRGVTSEFTTLEFIRTNARQLWEADLAIKEEEASRLRAAAGPTSSHRPGIAPTRPPFRSAEAGRASETTRPARAPAALPTRPVAAAPAAREYPARREAKGCFTCGGNDHFAKDKACPRYNERDTTRERPRVAAQRVEESYSDEDTGPFSDPENEEALLSEEEYERDPNTAPDLDDLINAANEADRSDPRFGAMRAPLHYYSMRIVQEDVAEPAADEPDVVEVTPDNHPPLVSDTPGLLSPLLIEVRRSNELPLGNYNPGPVCVVCHDCSLVVRRVPATPANGLLADSEYTVCVHLADVGFDPAWVALPASPSLATVPLPPVSESGIPAPGACVSAPRVHRAEALNHEVRGYPPTPPPTLVNADGDLLNSLGDPDLPPGVLIDVTTNTNDQSIFRSPEEEVAEVDRWRRTQGMRSFTAHEYDVNIRHLRRYRAYQDNEGDHQARLREWSTAQDENSRADPVFGPQHRAREAISAEARARVQESCLNRIGSDTAYEPEPAQVAILDTLGDRTHLHYLNMHWRYRVQALIQIRRLLDDTNRRYDAINQELDLDHEEVADGLWVRARSTNIHLSARLGYHLRELNEMVAVLQEERTTQRVLLLLHEEAMTETRAWINSQATVFEPLQDDVSLPTSDDEATFTGPDRGLEDEEDLSPVAVGYRVRTWM